MKAPKPRCTYITVRSCKNYTHAKFIEDLASIPFYIANIFDDLDDHVYVFNSLFLDVLNDKEQSWLSWVVRGFLNERSPV